MSEIDKYEMQHIAETLGRQFIIEKITDMELLNAMRKLLSVYRLLNRVRP